jgi:endonuclease/exonuclease/phosphatase family metal-dependent hydrolase
MRAAFSEGRALASFARFAALVLLAFGVAGAQALSRGNGDLRVMTYNVNEGTDFIEIQQAQGPLQFLLAVGQTLAQIRANEPRERMKAIARQIVDAGPALVSLQEVDRISSGTFDPKANACGPMTLEFDMLQDLLDALAAQGAHYTVAVQQQQYAVPPLPGLLPASGFLCASLVNTVVILARTDLKSSRFQWSNAQSANYTHQLIFPSPIGALPLPRAWVSVDATFNGKEFRFIGTHLESSDPTLRRLQGMELRAGPAATTLPVVIAMDSNAQAAPLPLDAAYADFVGAGYEDASAASAPSVAGFTCCQAQLSNNVVSQLTQRIDLILTHGPITTQRIELFGADPADKTANGFWPSDHAGVAAQLLVR